MRINGNTVLITGASQGIGAATATEFARHNATVLLVARDKEALDQVAATITATGGKAHVFPADISTVDGVENLVQRVQTAQLSPDILVNNAGAGEFRYIHETTPAQFERMSAVPYLASGYITTGFIPAMIKRQSGHIVIVNSPVSRAVWPAAAGYAAARWGLRGLTQALRVDLKHTGIKVTEVIPGEVASNYFTNNPGSAERLPRISRLLPRLTPQQVAKKLVKAVACNKTETIFPPLLRILNTAAQTAPTWTRHIIAATSPANPHNSHPRVNKHDGQA